MGYNKNHFTLAYEILNQRKLKNKAIQDRRINEIYTKFPEYKTYNMELSKVGYYIASVILNGEDVEANIKKLEHQNLSLQQKMAEILLMNRYKENYLDDIYTCEKCQDTGNLGNKWCECFENILKNIAVNELNKSSPLELSAFNNFEMNRYSDKPDIKTKINPRKSMEHNLKYCINYAENFHTPYNGIFMLGGTGLGKTHLSLAIANVVINKGYSVIYGPFPDIARKIEREHFGDSSDDTLEIVQCCDLLILDDLGAEFKSEFYSSVIYNILNTRQNKHLPTVINSNLSAKELQTRYNDRIISRISTLETLTFLGDDIRLG